MTEINSDYGGRSLDLHDVIHVISRRFRLILIIFLMAVSAAVLLSFWMPPTYEAATTLRIKQSKSLDNSLLADTSISNMETQKMVSTYGEILRSRTVIDTVIDKTQSPKISYDEMLSRITIEPVKDSEILKIKVRAGNAKGAMLTANTLVDTFLERLTKLVRSEDSAVSNFIEQSLIGAKQELDQAERALENYKREQQIAAPENETKALLERLSRMNQLKAENSVSLAAAQAKLEAAKKELSQGKNEFVADSPLIQQYKAKLTDLEVKLVGLLQKSDENDPNVVALKAEIEDTRAKYNTEINRVVNSEQSSMNQVYQNLLQQEMQASMDIVSANAQGVALNKITAAAVQEIGKLPVREQELVRLMRSVSLAQEIYEMLTKRREEAKINEAMTPMNVQIIDRAVLPDKPVIPNKILNILIAAILGLFSGVSLAFFLDYLNTTIVTVDDVKNYLNLPVLGNIPDFE